MAELGGYRILIDGEAVRMPFRRSMPYGVSEPWYLEMAAREVIRIKM